MPLAARSAPGGSAQAPSPEPYGGSAAWHLHLPPCIPAGLELLDDHHVAGPPWRLALGRHAQRLQAPLRLTLLPPH